MGCLKIVTFGIRGQGSFMSVDNGYYVTSVYVDQICHVYATVEMKLRVCYCFNVHCTDIKHWMSVNAAPSGYLIVEVNGGLNQQRSAV